MDINRKPRSDSKLDALTEDQREQLVDWMLASMPYRQIRQMVQKEFGVSISISALTAFWNRHASEAYLARRDRALGLAEEVAKAAEENPGRTDEAIADAIRQRAFEVLASPGAKPMVVKSLCDLLIKQSAQHIKREQLDLEKRRVALLEAKAQQADQVKTVVGEPLTPEEKQAKIRQIFGM